MKRKTGLYTLALLAMTGSGSMSFAQENTAVHYPSLGNNAPAIAVVFDHESAGDSRAAIYVLEGSSWVLAHIGPYNRGSNQSGRGGKGNRYRMISNDESYAELSFSAGNLRLKTKKGTRLIYPLPEPLM